MSVVWFKQGVWGTLQPEVAEGLRVVSRFWESQGWGDIFVTCIQEGSHLIHSFHWAGRAFDLRPPPRSELTSSLYEELTRLLGPKWFVLDEGSHWHFQCRYS